MKCFLVATANVSRFLSYVLLTSVVGAAVLISFLVFLFAILFETIDRWLFGDSGYTTQQLMDEMMAELTALNMAAAAASLLSFRRFWTLLLLLEKTIAKKKEKPAALYYLFDRSCFYTAETIDRLGFQSQHSFPRRGSRFYSSSIQFSSRISYQITVEKSFIYCVLHELPSRLAKLARPDDIRHVCPFRLVFSAFWPIDPFGWIIDPVLTMIVSSCRNRIFCFKHFKRNFLFFSNE